MLPCSAGPAAQWIRHASMYRQACNGSCPHVFHCCGWELTVASRRTCVFERVEAQDVFPPAYLVDAFDQHCLGARIVCRCAPVLGLQCDKPIWIR